MPDDHARLLDELMRTHSLFGAFDAGADEHFLVQVWDPPPADDNLLPPPGYHERWTA